MGQNDEKSTLDLAVVQFPRTLTVGDEGIERLLELLPQTRGADLVCLPEAWAGVGAVDPERLAEWFGRLKPAAAAVGTTLFTGGLFVRDGGRVRSAAHLIRPDGTVEGPWAKVFPSQAIGEREYCEPGGRPGVFDLNGIRVGVLICVDAMYPELARTLALDGARLLLNPANIPENRNELWRSLTLTRAAENTVFTAYVNNAGGGYRDGRRVTGGSVVAAPDGEPLLEAGPEPGIYRTVLDMARVQRIRSRWPYLDDVLKSGFGLAGNQS